VKQWKEYAKTLQHWGDFDGAAVLYNQAVTLMKESDMANTAACADIHVVCRLRPPCLDRGGRHLTLGPFFVPVCRTLRTP